jgi:hypothetical protein
MEYTEDISINHNFMSMKLAYLAGLFDGEGTFSIQVDTRWSKRENVRFNPRMSMSLLGGNGVLQELIDEFGGTIYSYDDGTRRWNLGTKNELIKATKKLLPYLRIKKHIGNRFLKALELFPTKRAGHRTKRSWNNKITQKVAYIALTLNPSSSRKSPKNIQYLEDLKRIYDET